MRKYEYYDTGADGDRDAYSNNWEGQTFTPETDHLMAKVKLKLFRVGSPGTVKVSIRATSADKPTGGDLCSGTIDGDTLTTDTNGEWYEITLGDGYEVEKDTMYAIVIRAVNGNASNKVSLRADTSSPTYTGGTHVDSSDSGADWNTYSGVDLLFEEWGTGPPSPTAVTWGNLLKSQISSEKIEEAITRMIQDHEDDPNAHIEEGESLQSHKASEVIDHVVHSVLGEKIHTSGKTADCIVATEGGDYTSIQAAIDAGEKNIFIKKGTYEISTGIFTYSSNIHIRGESKHNTIIKLADGANDHVIQFSNSHIAVNKVIIENIQINGNKANQTDPDIRGIYMFGGSTAKITNLIIRNCYIHDTAFNGIDARYTEHSIIDNNIIEDCGDAAGSGGNAIGLYNSSHVIVRDNETINNYKGHWYYYCDHILIDKNKSTGEDYGGININNTEKSKIINNTLTEVSGNGIQVGEGSNNNIVTGNQIEASGYGIWIQGTNTIVANNQSNSNNYGIITASNKNIIIGNQCNSNNNDGILLDTNASNNTIIGNYCKSNSRDGIRLSGGNDNNIINSNYCTENAGYGVNIVADTCDENYVTKNYLTGNTTGSFQDLGTNTIKAADTTNDNVI